MRISVKKLAICGVLSALALVLGYLEHLVPLPIGIYGIKLGLANLAVIVPLYLVGAPAAIAINTVRILLSSLLFGNTVSLWYSLAGAALSLLVMAVLKRTDLFSKVGVSIAGAVMHNVGQVITAVLVLRTAEIGYYLVVLLFTGILSGIFVGILGASLIKYVKIDWKEKK